MVARFNISEYGGKDGGGATIENKGIFGAIQCSEFQAQDIDSWIDTPAVQVAGHFIFKGLAHIIYPAKGKIAGLYNWWGDGIKILVAFLAQFIYYIGDIHEVFLCFVI